MNTLSKKLYILEKQTSSWDKLTIDYAIKHKSKIEEHIRKVKYCYGYEVDDIYEELIEYLHKGKDYEIGYINTEDGTAMTLEGYVKMCVNNCIKRYFTNKYQEGNKIVNIHTIGDMENSNNIENIMDKETDLDYEKIILDINSCLKALEYKRYKYGFDLYLLMFIRYITLGNNELYNMACNILIGEIFNINDIERDIDFKEVIRVLANLSKVDVIKELSNYVYGCRDILHILEMKPEILQG